MREAGNGKHASCDLGSTVFHADGFTKENGNGERKRSLGCARDDETGEVHLTFVFNPLRRLASFFAAKPPSLSLPHWGRGTASAVDRVLSLMAHLRRSPLLSFIPLVPYPARSARHLPHAGKASCRG